MSIHHIPRFPLYVSDSGLTVCCDLTTPTRPEVTVGLDEGVELEDAEAAATECAERLLGENVIVEFSEVHEDGTTALVVLQIA